MCDCCCGKHEDPFAWAAGYGMHYCGNKDCYLLITLVMNND